MLNISSRNITPEIEAKNFNSFVVLSGRKAARGPLFVVLTIFIILVLALFLPWTQNIRSKGYVTTLKPEQRPQAIQSVIAGQLEKWYVREGDFVQAGDTIVQITEVKDDYFDPQLVKRTDMQLQAKSRSIGSYQDKVIALENQYVALVDARDLKIEQTKNKITQAELKVISDSIDLVAAKTNETIAERQLIRTEEMYDKGLKSLTELETKKLKLQETQAKTIAQTNKLLLSRNELINWKIELNNVTNEYADKLAKAQSDKFSALSNQLNAEASTAKLASTLSNYERRNELYYITAPQAGYITKLVEKGLGGIIKEGTDIVTIMPRVYDLAVEVYVDPIDLPLLTIGNEARIQFDGWPAVVFSGWPNTSFGTYSGQIIAIDQFISDNGKYRLMIAPSDTTKMWPDLLRVGSGVNSIILLKNVAVWYEIWRQLNGFPPDFYQEQEMEDIKLKAPLRSVK